MAAPRKRPRPQPSNNNGKDSLPSTPSPRIASLLPNASSSPSMPHLKPDHSNTSAATTSHNGKRVRKTNSWYGSWPRVSKSSPSTQVARENIMGDTRRSEAAADLSRFETNKKEASTDSDGQSIGTLPTITETNAKAQQNESVSMTNVESVNVGDGAGDTTTASTPSAPSYGLDKSHTSTGNISQVPTNSSGWLSWLSRSNIQEQTKPINNTAEPHQDAPETTEPIQPQDAGIEPPAKAREPMRQTGSWFGLWSSSANPTAQNPAEHGMANEDTVVKEPNTKENEDVVMQDAPMPPAPAPTTAQPSAGLTWAFWSREPASRKADEDVSSTEQGELVVMGDSSETCPRKSNVGVNEGSSNKKESPVKPPLEQLPKRTQNTKSKRGRPQSIDIDEPPTFRPGIPNSDVAIKNIPSNSTTTSTHKAQPPNLLLPSFKSTYHMKENPSIVKQIAQFLLRTQQPPTNHVFLSKDPPKIKKAMAIACHSQGVPVSIMLLAKLIDLGVITSSRVGVCAMAGVSLGPFPDYKSGMGMLMGSAAELWQFADPASEVSKRYEHSLKTVVDYGARITFIGSIDDQLVPLESALFGPVSHPYIYRAVFIDGRNHAPDFLAHLVGFALRLRNLGISDHGLIRELSVPLAGSLYSGEGHSRLYDDSQVLAISHTLETTSASGVSLDIQKHGGLTNPNPYVLPWIMRGLLEEEFVKRNFEETAELLRQFDDWTPTTKALKDVKYRLEAVRSKL
ncbi:hypothetical protein GQX73_g8920 [Xylaria multiplex]|uniref:YMC020W-like alpha/beta hydrolase domain-containing protein n=1 Tax=Xylaria multiplex TaxID=323545 RepID=A0A7C8ILS5_9PEZI|nr:hypothetical protein GQX73_g8920 [Xylaria multiplex]